MLVWSNGNVYEGQFHLGELEGNGTFSWSDGRKYVG